MKSIQSRMIPGAWALPTKWLAMIFAVGVLPAIAQDNEKPTPSPFDMSKLAEMIQGVMKNDPTSDSQPQLDDVPELIEIGGSDDEDEDTEAQPPEITVSPEGRVNMHVRDLGLANVLQMLSIQSHRNIIASQNVSGTVAGIDLYDVTFEEALTAVLDSNSCGWRQRANFIYVYTNEQLKEMEATARPRVCRLFRLHYTRAADVQAMVQPLLSSEGAMTVTPNADVGIATSSEEAGGDTLPLRDCLLIIDYMPNIEQIAKVIADIDSRPKQVLIEATILNAQLGEENALGIDFNLVGGVDFQNLTSTSPGITDLTTGNMPVADMQKSAFTVRTDFNAALPATAGGFTFGIVKDSMAGFIRALETVTDTTVLANPKVPVLNKQRAEIIVGRRDGYLTTTVTETSAIQTVEFLETGTQLVVRPFIGDGDVRLEVHPEDSTGGLNAANLPQEQTTEVTTNIIVKDGQTILIGGLFREVTTSNRSQVPLFGNIPVAGALFRQTRDQTSREEIIILLTVRIIKDNPQDDEENEQVFQDVERYRAGMRQELQWFGRERLAQAHYRWALEHMSKGRLGAALWDVNLAINNNPRFLTAIQLKEKLLCRREWDEDASSVRGFIHRQIMKEQGLTKPLFERPAPPFDLSAIQGPSGFEEGETAPSPSPQSRGGPSDDPAVSQTDVQAGFSGNGES